MHIVIVILEFNICFNACSPHEQIKFKDKLQSTAALWQATRSIRRINEDEDSSVHGAACGGCALAYSCTHS